MRHKMDHSMKRAMKMAALAAMAGAWGGGRNWGNFGGPFPPGGPFGPGGAGGPFGGGGGRGRGRSRRLFGREELRLVLLKLISEEPRHGYDLIKAMEDLSGGHYSPSPGVIYPALAMLADEGLIAEQASDDARRKFAITSEGEKVLEEEAKRAAEVLERLTELGEHAEKHRAPPIERAGANLFAAVRQKMGEAYEDEETPHRIAEILDEAARKVERL